MMMHEPGSQALCRSLHESFHFDQILSHPLLVNDVKYPCVWLFTRIPTFKHALVMAYHLRGLESEEPIGEKNKQRRP